MIYLDTAPLIKLIRRESESDELADWIEQRRPSMLVSSTLAEVEVPRALRRSEPELLAAVPAVLQRVGLYEIDELVRATAAAYQDANLRSPNAIHLATAHAALGAELTAFVTYDKRLLASAEALGLPVAHPGA
ncbi:type II toxin-antitoxin system VapC family toxin [Gandjariella thermophila]|uniref:Ribonuclease VapC n=1 Tax=Gandjariella thermophila TaxID=1931992 RepID=A0A4D4JF40_9PSEU|nr:type II toxin-antitoxin system VapC family toxin [Gandjariella thermophila]GDY34032.1 ribonuclease VapC [Gandjariella thermophila]